MSNIIKNCEAKKHVFQPFVKESNHLYDEFKTKQAILEQAIRAGRSTEHVLALSQDLDTTVVKMQEVL